MPWVKLTLPLGGLTEGAAPSDQPSKKVFV